MGQIEVQGADARGKNMSPEADKVAISPVAKYCIPLVEREGEEKYHVA